MHTRQALYLLSHIPSPVFAGSYAKTRQLELAFCFTAPTAVGSLGGGFLTCVVHVEASFLPEDFGGCCEPAVAQLWVKTDGQGKDWDLPFLNTFI